ncbi:MAG: hypothetical protein V7776_14360 [Halopseudomonas aestusnigri]
MHKASVIHAVTRLISSLEIELEGKGVGIEISEDFPELERVCHSIEGRKQISEPFSSKYYDIMPRNGFWVRGFNTKGETVATQVMRLSELGETTLASYWQQHLKRLHGGKLKESSSPAAQRIKGRVIFHGDVWVDKSCARKNLAGLMSRIALSTALLKWMPDYVYGFMDERLCLSGFALKEGYFHCEPVGSHWAEQPREINPNDWLVWMDRLDLEYLATQKMISSPSHSQSHFLPPESDKATTSVHS